LYGFVYARNFLLCLHVAVIAHAFLQTLMSILHKPMNDSYSIIGNVCVGINYGAALTAFKGNHTIFMVCF
jgi:hypothetical protein